MAKLLSPDLALGQYNIWNASEGRFQDPFYCDRAQAYLLAGIPWSDPIWVYGREPTDVTVVETFYIPALILPGQIGWRWGSYCKVSDVALDVNDHKVNPPSLELEVWRTDLAAELSLFTSAVASDGIPFHEVWSGSNDFDGLMEFGKTIWCAPDVKSAPFPALASPGILQVAPSVTARACLIKVSQMNTMIGWLGGRPVFSGDAIADW